MEELGRYAEAGTGTVASRCCATSKRSIVHCLLLAKKEGVALGALEKEAEAEGFLDDDQEAAIVKILGLLEAVPPGHLLPPWPRTSWCLCRPADAKMAAGRGISRTGRHAHARSQPRPMRRKHRNAILSCALHRA